MKTKKQFPISLYLTCGCDGGNTVSRTPFNHGCTEADDYFRDELRQTGMHVIDGQSLKRCKAGGSLDHDLTSDLLVLTQMLRSADRHTTLRSLEIEIGRICRTHAKDLPGQLATLRMCHQIVHQEKGIKQSTLFRLKPTADPQQCLRERALGELKQAIRDGAKWWILHHRNQARLLGATVEEIEEIFLEAEAEKN